MSNQKHSAEFIQKIADMIERGAPRRRVAEELGISMGTISGLLYRYCQRSGAQSKRRSVQLDDINQIRELADKGMSMRQIGDKIGRSGATVAHLCRKYGIRTQRSETAGGTSQRITLPPRPAYTLPRKGDGADVRAQAELGLKCTPVYVDDLDNAMCVCRWPVADGLYCGERKPKYDGKPYCQEHHKIAYTGRPKTISKDESERRADHARAVSKHKLSRFEFVRKYVA